MFFAYFEYYRPCFFSSVFLCSELDRLVGTFLNGALGLQLHKTFSTEFRMTDSAKKVDAQCLPLSIVMDVPYKKSNSNKLHYTQEVSNPQSTYLAFSKLSESGYKKIMAKVKAEHHVLDQETLIRLGSKFGESLKKIFSPFPKFVYFLPPEIIQNRQTVLEIIKNQPETITYIPEEHQTDPEVLKTAVSMCSKAQLTPLLLNASQEIIIQLVSQENGIDIYKKLLPEEQKNEASTLAALSTSGQRKSTVFNALRYMPETLKDYKKIISYATGLKQFSGNDHPPLEHASERLRNDKKLVLEAINKSEYAYKYASDTLKNDPNVIMETARKTHGQWIIRQCKELTASAIQSCLCIAIEKPNKSMLTMLLKHKNCNDDTLLHVNNLHQNILMVAVKQGSLESIKIIIEHSKCTEKLLDQKDPNGDNALSLAEKKGNLKIF